MAQKQSVGSTDIVIENPAEIYVAARRALLDALDALQPHHRAIIVVGAQAVYLRTTRVTVGVAPYTQDADLAIDPNQLPRVPAIENVLSSAGFKRSQTGQPGSFTLTVFQGQREYPITVDLMVPEKAVPASARRSVGLDGHDRMVARKTLGLEAALIDHDPLVIAALDHGDARQHIVQVAGPGGLLVAKLQKLIERSRPNQRPDRLSDKDAGDIYRLFQATSVEEMARRLNVALAAEIATEVTAAALENLESLFGRRAALGIELAARSLGATETGRATMSAVCIAYVRDVLEALRDTRAHQG